MVWAALTTGTGVFGVPAHAQSLVVTTGTHAIDEGDSYTWAFALGDSAINMTGGDVTEVFSGTVFGTLQNYSVVGASAASFDLATFNVYGGHVNTAQSHGLSTFNLLGGEVGAFAQSFDASQFNMSGGQALALRSFDESNAHMTGGAVSSALESFDSSVLEMEDGNVDFFLFARDASTLRLSGGSVGALAQCYEQSTLEMSGGTVALFGESRNTSSFELSGGTLGAGFRAFDQSNIIIEAWDFSYAGGDIDFGGGTELVLTAEDDIFMDILDPFGFDKQWRMIDTLSMTYAGGATDSFNFYAYADSTNFPGGGGHAWDGTLTLHLLPAPSGLAILGLAGIGASRRRRSLSG